MNESHLLAHIAPRLRHRGQTVPVRLEKKCSWRFFKAARISDGGPVLLGWLPVRRDGDELHTRWRRSICWLKRCCWQDEDEADSCRFHHRYSSCSNFLSSKLLTAHSTDAFEHVKSVSPRLHLHRFVVPELFLSFGRKTHNFTSYTKGNKCKCPTSVPIMSKIMEKIVRY